MQHVNIEIKAACQDLGRIREILKNHQSDFKGIDHQVDTYFRVPSGRLKLREGNIENNLIHYFREDREGPKEASITLFRTESGSGIKEILTKALGILIVVDKQREIYFIGNVKFHLDKVSGLGEFVEIEAIGEDAYADRNKLYEQCRYFLSLFGTAEEDLISCSYSDLLLKGN